MLVSEVIETGEKKVSPQLAWYYRNRDRPEFKARYAARQRKHRKDVYRFISLYKLLWGCIDCGYARDASALDLDHVDGTKSFILARGGSRSWETVWRELAKCEVRCANCHRIKTYGGRYVGL